MQDIDFSKLATTTPLSGDEWISEKLISIDEDIAEINEEASLISIDKVPFDKSDAVVIVLTACVEILLDTFVGDCNNPHSLAHALNDKTTGIGKWCNKIHENIPHVNNPMDYQGGFDAEGNPIYNGSGIKRDISFGGGDHRVRTYDHDILRFVHAIRDYHAGQFTDGAYINGEFIKVASAFNSNGNPFQPCSWGESIIKYICHMFADFFSVKGLPFPGASFLSHASDRELRKLASEMYSEGLNMRTQVLQSAAFLLSDLIIRIYVKLKYKDTDYSEEAISSKKHLLLLCTNTVASAMNIGKVVLAGDPRPGSLNIPMITHTVRLAITCLKDSVDFNQRVISKVYLDSVNTRLNGEKTIILVGCGIYRTSNYLRICCFLSTKLTQDLEERRFYAEYLQLSIEEYEKEIREVDWQDRANRLESLIQAVPIKLYQNDCLDELVEGSTIKDEEPFMNLEIVKQYVN